MFGSNHPKKIYNFLLISCRSNNVNNLVKFSCGKIRWIIIFPHFITPSTQKDMKSILYVRLPKVLPMAVTYLALYT